MIPCISIDGVDGSGKTTLIQNLSKQYNVITLPRFYSMGMVPGDQEERCQWFRKQDAVYTTPIYISGYRLRLHLASEFKKGFHYKIKQNAQNLIAIDRGLLSLKAFSYASMKKNSNLNDSEIVQFLKQYITPDFENEVKKIIDKQILLFSPEPRVLEKLLLRRQYGKDDELLIRYQYEYYLRYYQTFSEVVIISPFESPDKIVSQVDDLIKGAK